MRSAFELADFPAVNPAFFTLDLPRGGTDGRSLEHIGSEVDNLEVSGRKLEAQGLTFDTPYTGLEDMNLTAPPASGGMGVYTGSVVTEQDTDPPEESLDDLRERAEGGDAEAQANLGYKYATGRDAPQDDAEALKWYRLAAEQGVADAQYLLALMYSLGRGVQQDYVQAHMWFNLAASRSAGARRESRVRVRDRTASRMTPDALNEAQRLAREWEAAHPR